MKSLYALLIVLLVGPTSFAGDPARKSAPVSLEVKKLTRSCYAVVQPGGKANAGFIVGSDAVLVVDALGSPRAAKALLKRVAEVSSKPVRYLALTHWHYDNTVGNQAFPKKTRILASDAAAKQLTKRLAGDRLLLGPASGMHGSVGIGKVREVNERIDPGREVDLGGLKVQLAVAGDCHTVGDLVVFVPSEKVLYAGDLAWNGYHPNVSAGSTFKWITALAQLSRSDIVHVVPGKGEPGGKELLNNQRHYLMTLRRLVKHLAKKKVAAADIVKLEIPKTYQDLGHKAWWPRSVKYVYGELMRGR